MPVRALLLAGASLTFAASAAFAQTPSPAVTQIAAADATDDGEIIVFGRGQVRQVTEVTQMDMRQTVAGSSPFKAIEKLPGVNFQSADPFGVYEWSTRISLRGFNQNQLGFTLDGVPLGDMSYGNVNGLHISRAIISDNVGSVRVSQGAGALGTASTSNLGGTIEFSSRELSQDLGVAGNFTYGSNDTIRGYAAIDSGDIGGFRAGVSYAYLNAKKWKGVGEQRSHQVNTKATYDFAGGGRMTGFVNFTDRRENDYQDLSLGMINRLGYDWDNISGDWPLALRIAQIAANRGDVGGAVPRLPNTAGTVYPAPFASVDDAYYDAGGLRRDWLGGLKLEVPLTDRLRANVQGYYHNNKGQGSWFTPYLASPSGNGISLRTTEYRIERVGFLGDLAADIGSNALKLSLWWENNDFDQARRFYNVAGATTPSTTALTFQSNPFTSQWDNAYNTETVQYALQDDIRLTDALSITAGFKGQSVKLRARENIVTGALALGNIKSEDFFLPQAGVLYKLGTGAGEVFANYTENQRAFNASATTGPFATTQAGFAALRPNLRPERSKTVEAGYRFGFGPVRGVIAGYYVDFSNRILGTQAGAGIVGNPVILANVGSVRSLGVEAGLTWKVIDPITVTASYAYNDSTYRDNVVNAAGAVTQAIKGKLVVDSPRHIGNVEIAFDQDGFYARANGNFMSERFFTYSNDRSVPGRALFDAKVGYRFEGASGLLNGFGIEGSVTNLTDKRYVATIGSNGYGFSGDNQTLLAGAPRQWFVTVRKDF
ncbi:TonB-dependent receptor [Polymorphobacter fuscus]|uniref:TonB-dependent receptor n=2 Tax=Sandarakinorhabdus fusca TaxID=1439888 RepID=A0A7C9KP02_9SPHN|nr:TonB-dependent receptor [Polymorphobacter fuscus]KAB7644980.1 TonB-dependent receptor [Polymorphobacter fuscus]MQT18144.1 TonB-dependent receptor [Polymorphobacter fuscus]